MVVIVISSDTAGQQGRRIFSIFRKSQNDTEGIFIPFIFQFDTAVHDAVRTEYIFHLLVEIGNGFGNVHRFLAEVDQDLIQRSFGDPSFADHSMGSVLTHDR